MTNATAIKLLDSRYGGKITLMDAINDSVIIENSEKIYVPEVEIKDSVFIKNDETIIKNSAAVHTKIKFMYFNPKGIIMTKPDTSYTQIPKSNKGFLARFSLNGGALPENLLLDYFVDISSISYRFETVTFSEENVIKELGIFMFDNLVLSDYPNIEFDKYIVDFMKYRDEILSLYF